MQLKGSQTEKNLEAALAGESIARNKYTFYSDKAKADGYEQIAELFEETAKNEKAHAQIWYNLLTGKDKTTQENLQLAADGEFFEWSEMYPQFAKVAREEGFDFIAGLFEKVAEIEKQHEERFKTLLNNVQEKLVFQRTEMRYGYAETAVIFASEKPLRPCVLSVLTHKVFSAEKQ